MAYFNHAFRKTFLATGQGIGGYPVTLLDGTTVTATTNGGFLTTPDLPTYTLNTLSQAVENGLIYGGSNLQWISGFVGIFDPKSNLSMTPDAIGDRCCPFYIAGSAIYSNDKIGPFHGGYTETNKSKMINPKYVSRMYIAEPCGPQNEVVHVGSTYYTLGAGAATPVGGVDGWGTGGGPINGQTPNLVNAVLPLVGGAGTGAALYVSTDGLGTVTSFNFGQAIGKGYEVGDTLTVSGDTSGFQFFVNGITNTGVDPITGAGGAACCKEFLCGETYYLRVDIKGSPALRYLNHNAYYTATAYTGCCPAGSIAPVAANSTEVMIKWANDLLRSPIVEPFLQIVVQDETGLLWYEPGTSAADLAIVGGDTWDNYPEGTAHIDGACAGLIINGAYVDTKFGDCTFQLTDFYEKEPVKIYVSEVDLNGDPCTFEGICVVHECLGTQANGLGETMVRDLQLSESYRQNFLHSDLRIREITQGNQIISAINRNGLYYGHYLQHSVPRHNNPSGTFDNDQYLLQIISLQFQNTFAQLAEVVGKCGMCDYEEFYCETSCDVPIQFPPIPLKRKDVKYDSKY
jgi:hypothetical protein